LIHEFLNGNRLLNMNIPLTPNGENSLSKAGKELVFIPCIPEKTNTESNTP